MAPNNLRSDAYATNIGAPVLQPIQGRLKHDDPGAIPKGALVRHLPPIYRSASRTSKGLHKTFTANGRPSPISGGAVEEFVAEKKFADRSIGQKIVFVGQLIVFICSSGFVFPLLLDDPNYDKVAKGAKVS